MNVYEMEGFLRGKCMPRDILVNESVAAYLVRKLNAAATMKAERDALAVENQALSAALSLISGSYGLSPHIQSMCAVDTPTTDAALAAIEARAKVEAIEQLAIQLEQLPDEALEFLSDAAEFETYQEEHHSFASISNPRAVANAVLSLVKEQSTDPREAK
ncbi:hypothetical protein PTT36_13220 [Serratia nevei]|uniref:hypothetical protein n=1 Tax=Serratia nevei TaxID=2703794 RepID=UPI00313AF7FB